MTGAFVWIATWIVAIAVFVALANTAWGKPIVYYMLWLLVVLLLLSHADDLTKLIDLNALNLNG